MCYFAIWRMPKQKTEVFWAVIIKHLLQKWYKQKVFVAFGAVRFSVWICLVIAKCLRELTSAENIFVFSFIRQLYKVNINKCSFDIIEVLKIGPNCPLHWFNIVAIMWFHQKKSCLLLVNFCVCLSRILSMSFFSILLKTFRLERAFKVEKIGLDNLKKNSRELLRRWVEKTFWDNCYLDDEEQGQSVHSQ